MNYTTTKELPILFNAEEVNAVLEGRKTQTRRVIKTTGEAAKYTRKPLPASGRLIYKNGGAWDDSALPTVPIAKCPYGKVGDRLWVWETWQAFSPDENFRPMEECKIIYRATDNHPGYCASEYAEVMNLKHNSPIYDMDIVYPWRSPTHMPRWASRITLEITDIRVERVQDITEQDAIAEGAFPSGSWGHLSEKEVSAMNLGSCRCAFANIWNLNNEKRGFGWTANPYVWCLAFKKV